jgi:hypothetical protein
MTDTTISVRVDKDLREQMKMHENINWSAVLRGSISEQLENLEQIDLEQAKKASLEIDKIRKSKVFSAKPLAEDLIRKWRDKKRL